ncbi:MAG: ATP-binding cassette domain-containing protein [Mucilaginibacter sp.]
MANLLEVDSVIISFDHKQIVTDCYLKCATGEVIGILGRNGCGKSSLLKVIFGTLSAKSKFIRINGQVYDQPYKTGNLIAYLPQHAFLPQNISIKRIINIFISDENSRNKILNNPMLKNILKNVFQHYQVEN